MAALEGNAGIVTLLLAAGADINARKNGGDTPLCVAVKWKNIEIVRHLLAAGADPNVRNRNGYTLLDYSRLSWLGYAAFWNYAALVAALQRAGGKTSAELADQGESPRES